MGVHELVLDAQRHKKFRLGQNLVSSHHEDRISNLPQDLRTHILSFLPTQDAVRTSVLSTKWNHLWTNVTTLRFNDDSFRNRNGRIDKTYFKNFMKRVLLLGSPVIHTFHLSCSVEYDKFRVWISAVIKRNVRKLHITTHTLRNPRGLPCSLYNSDSMTELNLETPFTFTVPASSFSCLKILKLKWVRLLNAFPSGSNEIHMTFPVLDELYLSNCKWAEVVNVDAPRLKSFSFSNFCTNGPVIRIHGSSLKKINLSGCAYEEFVLTTPSSVTYASIHHYIFNPEERIKSCLFTCSFFKQLSDLKFLTLDWANIEALGCIEDLQNSLPTLSHVIQLTITVNGQAMAITVNSIAFLWSVPILETLNIELVSRRFYSDEIVQDVAPPCFQTHLKVVKFQISRSTKCLLEFAKFLLKNAMVLEKMSIYGPKSDVAEIKKKLVDCPRGSDHASISFNK